MNSALVSVGDDGDNTDKVIQASVERRKVRGWGGEEKGMTREEGKVRSAEGNVEWQGE